MSTGSTHREAVRAARRRRLWLLVAATPLVLALAVAGTRFILLTVATGRAEAAYADGRFAEAARIYGSQTWLNVVDPWKVHYNRGTAQLREGSPTSVDAAVDTLETAYSLTKSESAATQCLVQTNLALAYETAGDQRAADAEAAESDRAALVVALGQRERGADYDRALVDTYADRLGTDPSEAALDDYVAAAAEDATTSYQAAVDARGRPGCPQSTPQDQQQNQDATERVQDKLGQDGDDESDDGDEPQPSPSPSPDPSQDPDEADRQEQLQDMNDQAQREAYEDQQRVEDTFGDDTPRVDKKW